MATRFVKSFMCQFLCPCIYLYLKVYSASAVRKIAQIRTDSRQERHPDETAFIPVRAYSADSRG